MDVVVIGLGPGGGEIAAGLLDAGLQVAGVERELVGGECPYWGCVPSKMIVRGAEVLAEARRRDGGGSARREVLGLLALAVHARVAVPTLRSMTYVYPTFHRGVLDALADLGAR